MDNKIVVLCAKSSAGKDSLAKLLQEREGYNFVVSHTTRPPRVNEVEGNPYYFIDNNDKFKEMADNNEFIEYRTYHTLFKGEAKTYYYGVHKNQIKENEKYVVVLDPHGLNEFKKFFGSRVISFYITVLDGKREERAMSRGSFDATEWIRRLEDDDRVFTQLTFLSNIDYIRNNNSESIEDCYDKILNKLKGE